MKKIFKSYEFEIVNYATVLVVLVARFVISEPALSQNNKLLHVVDSCTCDDALNCTEDNGIDCLFGNLFSDMGYSVTESPGLLTPSELNNFAAIVLTSYAASSPGITQSLADYLWNGGGIVLVSGIPFYLAGKSTDLSPLQPWFGASVYGNSGGLVTFSKRGAPFDPLVSDGDSLFDITAGSLASISSVIDTTNIVGTFADGNVFCYVNIIDS